MLVCFDASYERERGGRYRRGRRQWGTAYKPPPRPNSSTAVRALAVSQPGPVAASAAAAAAACSWVYTLLSTNF